MHEAPTVIATSASSALGTAVADALGTPLGSCTRERFPDSEAHVAVHADVRDREVYVVGSTSPPVDAHLMELALLTDACRRGDAGRITAVIPYFGYARQDRRSAPGEAVATRVAAEVLEAAGVQRVVVVDPHTPALEAMFGVPVEAVTAVPMLARALQEDLSEQHVVVAPDLGAVKLAERVAAYLELPTAVVRKTRVSGAAVETSGLVGDVRGMAPVLVDDMVSTAGTLEAAAAALRAAGCQTEMLVAAVHGLFVGGAVARLAALPLRRLVITDSVPPPARLPAGRVETLAPMLASTIARLERGESLGELAAHG